ncbi:vWA domain-containing protein [Candidatus Nanohalococcus occultus]|uniref:VWFA domain containing protein n=1 Tax=Candidatus Nanohalococcus occultus TaxID=2978047 RepID=A0ABY8CJI9_9ARCH|nr:vWFA domain containing protein [Candidatus Nanohaloarchaeota archaeon SVXNc]
MISQQLTAVLSNYFSAPAGFLALLSLIPLALFYFMKPEPEERIMPSMAFFMKKKKSGKMEQALSRLVANLLLVLHILFVVGAAAAIAQPYIIGEQRPENSVILVDVSASMGDDFSEAKSFATSNLGEENTVIVAGEDTDVLAQSASAGQARSIISEIELRDVESDIVSGIELAQSYEGNIVLASDTVQTSDSNSAKQLADSLGVDRSITGFDASNQNKWGIIEVDDRGRYIEVKNFMNQSTDLEIDTPAGSRNISLPGEEVRKVELETETGRNTVELPEDGLEADNTAYISIPENQTVEVTFVGDQVNPYFREAVEAISFTTFKSVKPPIDDSLDADVYVVGETNEVLSSTASELQSEARNGKSLVLFAQPDLKSKGFNQAPAKIEDQVNATVEVTRPRRINIGRTEVFQTTNVTGSNWAIPSGTLVNRNYGAGNIVLYNLNNDRFRYDFYYPVFWKGLFEELEERPSASQLNVETGERVEGTRITSSGFYNLSGSTYASNLESVAESNSEPLTVSSTVSADRRGQKDLQNFTAGALALLAALEVLYLKWIGEL